MERFDFIDWYYNHKGTLKIEEFKSRVNLISLDPTHGKKIPESNQIEIMHHQKRLLGVSLYIRMGISMR